MSSRCHGVVKFSDNRSERLYHSRKPSLEVAPTTLLLHTELNKQPTRAQQLLGWPTAAKKQT